MVLFDLTCFHSSVHHYDHHHDHDPFGTVFAPDLAGHASVVVKEMGHAAAATGRAIKLMKRTVRRKVYHNRHHKHGATEGLSAASHRLSEGPETDDRHTRHSEGAGYEHRRDDDDRPAPSGHHRDEDDTRGGGDHRRDKDRDEGHEGAHRARDRDRDDGEDDRDAASPKR